MKKFFLALLAIVGFVGYKRAKANKAEQDLWTQATSE